MKALGKGECHARKYVRERWPRIDPNNFQKSLYLWEDQLNAERTAIAVEHFRSTTDFRNFQKRKGNIETVQDGVSSTFARRKMKQELERQELKRQEILRKRWEQGEAKSQIASPLQLLEN